MLKRFLLPVLAVITMAAWPAQAQLASLRVVPSCGSGSAPTTASMTIDANGNLCVTGGTSSGGGSGNAATTSNATDGQATSTTNQQHVAYNYLFNGSTWDRVLGTNGAAYSLGGIYNSTLPSLASGTQAAVSIDTNGKVLIQGGNSVAVKTDGSATTQPISGNVGLNAGSNTIGAISNTAFGLSGSIPAGSNVIGGVTGNVAAGSTDSGAAVKTGGVYNSTPPTYTTGQRGDTQLTAKGGTLVAIQDPAGTATASVIAPSADAATTTYGGLNVNAFGRVFNGSAWDRARSASAAAGTTGTGVLASGQMLFDGTNFRSQIGDSGGKPVTSISYVESTALSVAASATSTGTTRDSTVNAGGNSGWSQFKAVVNANAAGGTLKIQGSNDNSTFFDIAVSSAVTANVPAALAIPTFFRYNRAVFVNSSNAVSSGALVSMFTAN